MTKTPSMISLHLDATALAVLIDECVDAKLASLGGEMLSVHGPDSEHPNNELASMGGYLLQAFGKRIEDVPDELRDPPTTGE